MGTRHGGFVKTSLTKAARAALGGVLVLAVLSCGGPPEALELVPSETKLVASGMDTTRVNITAITAKGRPARSFSGTVTLTLSGDGAVLMGDGRVVLDRGTGST